MKRLLVLWMVLLAIGLGAGCSRGPDGPAEVNRDPVPGAKPNTLPDISETFKKR